MVWCLPWLLSIFPQHKNHHFQGYFSFDPLAKFDSVFIQDTIVKQVIILISFLTLVACNVNTKKLQIATIYAEPKRVSKKNLETGVSQITTHQSISERFKPQIYMISKNHQSLKFRIQGNIHSSGHQKNEIEKIRSGKAERYGDTITLRYFVEVKRSPGKENANVRGYNYTTDEIYKIPNAVKRVKIELYEDRMNFPIDTRRKLVAQQTFNFLQKSEESIVNELD